MLAKLWNIWWTQWTWPLKLISAAVVIALVLLPFVLLRSCNKPPKVLTEQEKQEINNAIADRDEKKLKEKLAEIEAEEEIIEGDVANANAAKWAAIQNSKEKWANANISELQAEFDRRMKE